MLVGKYRKKIFKNFSRDSEESERRSFSKHIDKYLNRAEQACFSKATTKKRLHKQPLLYDIFLKRKLRKTEVFRSFDDKISAWRTEARDGRP